MAYFVQQAVYQGTSTKLPNGQNITLDFVSDDLDGYLASENGYVVNQIRGAITAKTGGWLEVSEADYLEAVKKKAQPSPKSKRFRSLNAGMFQPKINNGDEGAALAAVVDKPDPIQVPTAEEMKLPPRPRVGKMVSA